MTKQRETGLKVDHTFQQRSMMCASPEIDSTEVSIILSVLANLLDVEKSYSLCSFRFRGVFKLEARQ